MNLQQRVFEALNRAIENGYDFEDFSDEEVAEDLTNYDSSFEGEGTEELARLVHLWRRGGLL